VAVGVDEPRNDERLAQTQRHQLDKARSGSKGAPKAPDAALIYQRAALERAGHQLSQEHRTAATAIDELTHRRRVHRPSKHRDQQLFDRRVVEDAYLDTLGRTVLPQGNHRIGSRLTRRTVARTVAARVSASWWRSIADPLSRRWASSTNTTSGRPPAPSATART
jgi:hypothetical protein